MAQERPPTILQIFREPLKLGSEAAYKTVEDDTARLCVELKCPHPHLAMEPVAGPKEVWWLNAFESEADKQRVEAAYAKNRVLMAALGQNSKRKTALTGTPVNIYARYRVDLSQGSPWTLTGARFVVVAITHQADIADGSVFDTADGSRYIFKPVAGRQQAEAEAGRLGRGARIFAVLPHWGLPAKEWVAADPDFWGSNPVSRK